MGLVDKPKATFALGDYVEVRERIALFYAAHPTGALVTGEVRVSVDDDTPRVWVQALAYRTPDDPHPAIGWSWMELPGKTPYTKGSEIENTETSAWGRAIGALGIGIARSIASANEVRAKMTDERPAPEHLPPRNPQDGLIGVVASGKPPVDLNLRQSPDGAMWGFKLTAGGKGYQALATGSLADALAMAAGPDFVGTHVTVHGRIEMVDWEKDGKSMPPYARIAIERVTTPDWTLPAVEPEPTEAESIAAFPDIEALKW